VGEDRRGQRLDVIGQRVVPAVERGERLRGPEQHQAGARARAGLMLFRASKALAALNGRDHTLPDDVQSLAPSVLAHRLLLSYEVEGDQRERVIRDAVDRVPAL